MEYSRKMTPSQKIKELREHRKYTQEALASALKCSKSKVSKAEAGECEYSERDIKLAKAFFGVENAPFNDRERIEFKQRLYKWKHWIKNSHIDEARQFQKNVSAITKLPFEPTLNMLYRMFEIRLVLKEGKPDLAEEMLRIEETDIENASEENQHHFYYNLGSVYFYRYDLKNALFFYRKALDLEMYALEKDVGLHFNLAMCYGELGKYVLAITTIENAYHEFEYNMIGAAKSYMDSMLAINYVRIGQVSRAKQLLDRSLTEAMGSSNQFFTYLSLHNYGCACFEAKEYDRAIEYFDRVIEYFKAADRHRLEAMYYKFRCLVADKKTAIVKPLLYNAMSEVEGNEHYRLAFESLLHMATIKQDESMEFIEKKTIPYFIKERGYYKALDYCIMLESIYRQRGKGYKTRALEVSSLIRNMAMEIAFGEGV